MVYVDVILAWNPSAHRSKFKGWPIPASHHAHSLGTVIDVVLASPWAGFDNTAIDRGTVTGYGCLLSLL